MLYALKALVTSCGTRRGVDLRVYGRLLSGSWPTDEVSQNEKAAQFLTIIFCGKYHEAEFGHGFILYPSWCPSQVVQQVQSRHCVKKEHILIYTFDFTLASQ